MNNNITDVQLQQTNCCYDINYVFSLNENFISQTKTEIKYVNLSNDLYSEIFVLSNYQIKDNVKHIFLKDDFPSVNTIITSYIHNFSKNDFSDSYLS